MQASKRRIRRSARQLFRFCLVGGQLDEARASKVVERAVASRRRGVIAMLTEFQRLVRLDRQRHSARVESAVPVSDRVRGEIVTGVASTHGPGITTSFVDNPALIGGMRIQVGSDVYDGSIRGRLDAIESKL